MATSRARQNGFRVLQRQMRHYWRVAKAKGVVKMAVQLAIATFFGGLALLGILFLWYSRDLPNPDEIVARNQMQSTKIFDRTGEHLLYEIAPEEKRTLVKIEDIPLTVQHAVITAEDRSFYDHVGISPKGLLRAVLFGGTRGGGSTITQQFVKNAILTNERHVSRKVKEIILSLAIEQRFTKEQILQLYLNEIPYGGVLYGVESAAQAYFGKSIRDVSLAEAATLAALPQRPSTFLARPDLLDARRDWILDGMVELGYASAEEGERAKAEEVPITPAVGTIEAPHFVLWVKEQLEEQYGVTAVETGGMRVLTTLDYDAQKAAEEAVKKGVEERGTRFNFSGAGLLAIDPKNGEIRAMVGSPDFFNSEQAGQVNVTLQPLQPGSSIKPIIYLRALERGYTPDTLFWDVKTNFGGYTPNNYDGGERGLVSMRNALQWSLNIPAVQALYLIGVDDAIEFMKKIGYTTPLDADRVGLSMVLGGAEVTMLDHVNAYAMLAADGMLYTPKSIRSVQDGTGEMLFTLQEDAGARKIDGKFVAAMTNILADNGARAAVFGAANHLTLPDRPVAAKTGTTNNYKDAWSVGYTPQLAAGVWVGNADGSLMNRGADGSQVAAPIWQAFMRTYHTGKPVEGFATYTPEKTGKAMLDGQAPTSTFTIDRASGKLATERTPLRFQEVKVCGEYHSILHYVNKQDVRGAAPTNPERDPFYAAWEGAVTDYIARHNAAVPEGQAPYEVCTPPTESDDLHIPKNEPRIALRLPQNNDQVSGLLELAYEGETVRPFSRVEVSIGGQYVGEITNLQGGSLSIPSWVPSGNQTLQVTIFDDIDNSAADSVQVRLLAQEQVVSAHFVTPTQGEVIFRTQDPFTVGVEVRGAGIRSASVRARNRTTGEQSVIGEIASPGAALALPWKPVSDGVYRLELLLVLEDGSTWISAPRTVVVRPPQQ